MARKKQKKQDKPGRPSKLTPELKNNVVKQIKSGNYIETAAAFNGIDKTNLYKWMKRGAREEQRVENATNPNVKIRKEEQKFVDFKNEVDEAQAFAEVRDVNIIGQQAQESWQAAAWRLERKFPEKWGRKDRVTAELDHKGDVNINMTDEQVSSRIEELENKLGLDKNDDD